MGSHACETKPTISRYSSARHRSSMKKPTSKKLKKPQHRKLPPLDLLLAKYDYNPLTGIITNKRTEKPIKCKPGCYGTMTINKRVYKIHRIAFYMFHRRDPKDCVIDHINGIKSDNNICNLRACSSANNACNTKQKRDAGVIPKPEPGTRFLWTMDRSKFLASSCSY